MNKEFYFTLELLLRQFIFSTSSLYVQLHLIFNQRVVSCSINHLIHQTWLLDDSWLFPKIKFTFKAERFASLKPCKKCEFDSEELKEFQVYFGIEKNSRLYFAVQSHSFSYLLLLYHFRDETQICIKYSKCINESCA